MSEDWFPPSFFQEKKTKCQMQGKEIPGGGNHLLEKLFENRYLCINVKFIFGQEPITLLIWLDFQVLLDFDSFTFCLFLICYIAFFNNCIKREDLF